MAVFTTAGTTLFIKAGQPSTFDSTGYDTLFSSGASAVGEITDLGEFGREYALVTHSPIGSRGVNKFKGSFNQGQMQLSLGLDTDNAGQILMKTASLSDSDYSFRITMQGGDIYYFQAKVMTWKVNAGSVDSITTATSSLELTANSAGVGVVEKLLP
jgi:hypothetical protein